MFYKLPPAGNQIDYHDTHCNEASPAYPFSSDAYFFNSGAASLATAVLATIQHSNAQRPEVLLPAYACPELVSAVLFAKAKPILVDLATDRTWMDLAALSAKLTEQTCAVIAVSLFGIPERLTEIRQVLQGRSICLIEDCAQTFPEKEGLLDEQGDLVIYSFGRGKPVSVLGGGAVLVNNAEIGDQVANIHQCARLNESSRLLSHLKIKLYNQLISPRLYWLLDILPFLQLGKTTYHPLTTVKRMDESGLRLLSQNITKYWLRKQDNQDTLMRGIAERGRGTVIDLGMVSHNGKTPRLLRYPLLFKNTKVRNELYEHLNRLGLGASKMYPSALQHIDGLEHFFPANTSTPNADSFSKRILTLPIHDGVSKEDISKMVDIIG